MTKISSFNGLGFRLLALILLAAQVLLGPISAVSFLEMGGDADAVPGENGSTTAKGLAEALAAGVWIAPDGGDNVSEGLRETLLSLSGPARILRIMVQEEEVSELGYIGTSDGVLVLWPDITETLRLIAPFDYRERPWYLEAARANETIWTKPYLNQSTGNLAITCATPISVGGNLTGVVGMDVSLAELDSDLANIYSGYPFLLDGQGVVVMRPDISEAFLWEEIQAPGSLLDSKNSELAELAEAMVRGENGTSFVRLGKGSARIAYAPLPSVGWSLAVTSGDQELAAAKASQYDQLFRRISGQTEILALETGEALKDRGRVAMITSAGRQDGEGKGAGATATLPLIITAALSAILAGVIGFRAGRNTLGPMVDNVARALEGIGRGDLDSKIQGDGSRGMRALGKAFDEMTIDLKDQISLIEKRSFEAGRSEKEQEVSEEVKRFLLPERIPQVEGYQVATLSLAEGRECCHFYDVFEMEEAKAVVVMAEISGKGLSAAMVAALTRSLIRAATRRFGDPAKALRETNLHISDNVKNGMMVSCFCGMLDLSSHAMNYANAGHVPPFIVSSDGFVDTLVGGAISMGALDHIDLEMEGWMIDPGDVLVIYNDSLIEVENENNERFGTENLITLVKGNRERSAQDIMKEMEKAIRDHMGSQSQRFDPAVMIVKRSV
ncbi:MAG TPA: SpoIIE family protein phosphatase [Methanotrichaceae archaeon]|nr:SpoIIE family protein phosphatase [Methanotrichaceae archaeon]